MDVNIWPASAERVVRLGRFHASSYYPAAMEHRGHDVSAFWLQHIAHIRAFGWGDAIGVVSATTFLDPQRLAERRAQLSKRRLVGRVGRLLGKLALFVPEALWNRFARGLAGLSEVSTLTRQYEAAAQAFRTVCRLQSNPVLRLDTLDQVRVLADQTHASPVLSLYIACAVNALGPHLTHHRVKTVLEIGPASALFAISLRMLYGCRFVLVDLPEVLNQGFATISYYVPDAEIVLPNEVEDGGAEVWQKDFVLLVPEQIDLIPSGSLDCAINMSSFQEMTYPLIAKYFQLIRRCLREAGLFYCLNETRFSRHPDGKAIEFESYPWFDDFQDLFYEDFAYLRLIGSNPRKHRLQIKGLSTAYRRADG